MAQQAYAAFLRGVSPMNAKMPELKRAFERAGFGDVRTLLSSGNVVFSTAAVPITQLERRCEMAMQKHLGKAFITFIRPINTLRRLLASDPYAEFELEPRSKRIVTFLHKKPRSAPALPIE